MRLQAIVSILAGAAVLAGAADAGAYSIAKGAHELRPLIGASARLTGQPSQFIVGLDWGYSLNGPTALVIGGWTGVADEYIGLALHFGVKHRFLGLHRRVAPFLVGGLGLTWGFPTPGGTTRFGMGFRFGGGIDFFVSRRVLTGFQMLFDVGPRFSPDVGALGSAQITFGFSFLW